MTEKWQRWTIEEYTIVEKHYPNFPRDDLMRLLPGRTWRAIGDFAEKQKIHRNRHNVPLSEEEKKILCTKLSIARSKRSGPPFAGKHHSAETKLTISVSNLHTRGHSIADIAQRNGIVKEKVMAIIEGREERKMSKEAEIEKEAKNKTKSIEPFIRANPHTGRWEPVRDRKESH